MRVRIQKSPPPSIPIKQEFCGLLLGVKKDVLVPRAGTASLVRAVQDICARKNMVCVCEMMP